jgi:branched-chain amino acid aminotransferase
MRTVYLDGQFVPESEAKLSIYDLSVMQAAAAFEMTRSFNGVHFKLREHIARLEHSCKLLSIPMPCSAIDLRELCCNVADENDHGPGEEHRLLIVVSPGCAPMYKDLEGVIPHPFVYIADFPLRYTVAGFSKYFTEGVHAVTSAIRQAPDDVLPSAAKHRSRLHFHLAQQAAPQGTWPLMLDEEGNYCEAPGANIMFSRGELVWTCESDALPGISMQTVKELTDAAPAKYRCHSLLSDADELWLTGTPFCMLPVVSLDGKPIGDGTIGPVFKATLAKWSRLVGVDIQGQIESWDAARPHTTECGIDLPLR